MVHYLAATKMDNSRVCIIFLFLFLWVDTRPGNLRRTFKLFCRMTLNCVLHVHVSSFNRVEASIPYKIIIFFHLTKYLHDLIEL